MIPDTFDTVVREGGPSARVANDSTSPPLFKRVQCQYEGHQCSFSDSIGHAKLTAEYPMTKSGVLGKVRATCPTQCSKSRSSCVRFVRPYAALGLRC